MITKLVSLKDVKIGYKAPGSFESIEVAKRQFKALVKTEGTEVNTFKDDMEIWHVGEFNTETGYLQMCEPVYIMGGKDVIL